MPAFTPPTANVVPAVLPETRGVQRRLFRYFGANPRGRSVVFSGGRYVLVDNPSHDLIANLTEGVTYFLGGHVYWVDDAIGALLVADGFTLGADAIGFGAGGFGEGAFGT